MIDPLIGVRALHFAATAIAAGMMFFASVITRPLLGAREAAVKAYFRRLDVWVWAALAIVVVSGLAWALLIAGQLGDAPVATVVTDGTLTTLLTQTRFGHVWIIRAGLVVVIVLTLLPAARWERLQLVAVSLVLASLAWVGHSGARADAVGWVQVCADMAHLLAAGLWVGSLPALALLLARRLPSSANVTRRFSSFGIIAVATLLITGLANTYLLTDSIAALTETTYGQLLLVKIGLFGVMVVLAAINRVYWTPSLPEQRAMTAIYRQSLGEIALGLGIFVCVGALGTLPPPLHRHVHSARLPDEAAFVHIHDVRAMADVTILPGRPGPSEIWIRLMREDFSPMPADAVSVRLSQAGGRNVVADARSGVVGLWRAPDVVLRTPGVWTIAVEVTTATGERIVLDGPIVLDPGSAEKSAESQ